MQTFGENWLVIGLMLSAAFAMGMTLLLLNWAVAPAKPNPAKTAPYESGVPDVSPVKPRYTPRFYVVAMLFVVFIYPWAVIFDQLGVFGFVEMLVFIALLFAGYVCAWKKGALEWV